MAYDVDLAARVRRLVATEPGITERAMFGGLAFLVDGRMAVAVSGEGGLMVRVDPSAVDGLLQRPGAGPMEMRGRAMKGWLRVDAAAVSTARLLGPWVRTAVRYARELPAQR